MQDVVMIYYIYSFGDAAWDSFFLTAFVTTLTSDKLFCILLFLPFQRQPHNMIRHNQAIRLQKPINCLSVFHHFVGLVLKVGLSPSKKIYFICFNEDLLKLMKNAFYFILKGFFVLKILKFLSWLFGHVGKKTWLERQG